MPRSDVHVAALSKPLVAYPGSCHFRVEVTDPRAKGFRLLDASGEVPPIHRFENDEHRERTIVGLTEGRSPSLTTSSRARRLSILDGERKEIARVDVHLEVGRVTVLQR